MQVSGWSLPRWALRWWPAAVDLGLALSVLVLTADQGTGTADTELFGEAPAATRMLLGVGTALLVVMALVVAVVTASMSSP
jgi:hypothetical protein